MEVQSLGPLRVGSLLWQSPRGGWVLTVVGKATFDLLQGDARLSERQEDVLVRDRLYEDGQGGVHTSTDLVPFKPHVDVYVVGHAFAAREETPRVIVARVAVGEIDKSVELGPETRVDVDPAGPQHLTLPRNVGGDAPEVGFGPHPESARMRRERLGRHAATWSLADLADKPLPEDIDPAYFNAAPANQRLQLLREDAVIALDHLHPTQPRLATKLPNVRARAFAETEQGVADVRMAADTLCVDANRGVATVTWRGQVLLENPSQAGTVLLTVEHASRALGCAPADRIAADRHAMLALPPVAPQTGWRASLRLPRDHYVRLDANDYSVHPAVIGRRVEVSAGLDRVRAWCGGQLVADHERAWAWHQVITDPEHKAAAVAMRRQRVGMLRPVGPEPEVEQRPLSVYDALAGGDGEGAA